MLQHTVGLPSFAVAPFLEGDVELFHVPSVDEWWKLTRKYPQFRTPSNLTLKEYGYMRLFELIEERRPRRILEFGHGFSGTLFAYCEQKGIEVWGVDDHMDLPYFPERDVWIGRHESELARAVSEPADSEGDSQTVASLIRNGCRCEEAGMHGQVPFSGPARSRGRSG